MFEVMKLTSLSHGDVARELGVSRQFVHQLVKGNRPIPAKHKKKIYKLLMNNLIDNLENSQKGVEILSGILKESVVSQSK